LLNVRLGLAVDVIFRETGNNTTMRTSVLCRNNENVLTFAKLFRSAIVPRYDNIRLVLLFCLFLFLYIFIHLLVCCSFCEEEWKPRQKISFAEALHYLSIGTFISSIQTDVGAAVSMLMS
jgi:hypothetical protein